MQDVTCIGNLKEQIRIGSGNDYGDSPKSRASPMPLSKPTPLSESTKRQLSDRQSGMRRDQHSEPPFGFLLN